MKDRQFLLSIQWMMLAGASCWHLALGFHVQPLSSLRPSPFRSGSATLSSRHSGHCLPFQVHSMRQSSSSSVLPATRLFQTEKSEGSSEAPKRRRKRTKRKESATDKVEEEPPKPEKVVEPVEPKKEVMVEIQVRDIRDLVGGSSGSVVSQEPSTASTKPVQSAKTSAASTSMSSSEKTPVSTGGSPSMEMDSLERLLQDAKEMKALEEKDDSSSLGATEGDGGISLPDSFRSILSTIVTIDFFVVCGFLLWFLAGIFCSYILKDDTVQIAFNRKSFVSTHKKGAVLILLLRDIFSVGAFR